MSPFISFFVVESEFGLVLFPAHRGGRHRLPPTRGGTSAAACPGGGGGGRAVVGAGAWQLGERAASPESANFRRAGADARARKKEKEKDGPYLRAG